MRRLLESKDVKAASDLVPKTYSLIDRAAKWGIIKKNTAARYKSRLTLRLRKRTLNRTLKALRRLSLDSCFPLQPLSFFLKALANHILF